MSDLTLLAELAAQALAPLRPISAAELHGTVCGLGVFPTLDYPFEELIMALGAEALDDREPLATFAVEANIGLDAEDFSFAPLLPDDDASLEQRVAALGEWCGGFLAALGSGLGAGLDQVEGGGHGSAGLPDEVQEIVDDLAAIAEVDAAGADDDSAAEAQLLELQEFVKVGVLLIRSVFAHGAADSAD